MDFINYLWLLFRASQGLFSRQETEKLCLEYCLTKNKRVKRLLLYQLREENPYNLQVYLATCGEALWDLYLEVHEFLPQHLSMERTFIRYAPITVFSRLSQPFSPAGEEELFKSYEAGEQIEKAKWYVKNFNLSVPAFECVLQCAENVTDTLRKEDNLKLLRRAVGRLVNHPSGPSALSDENIQLRLLNFSENRFFTEKFLHFYNMRTRPSEKVTQKLLEISGKDSYYIREVLSHSCFGPQREKVFKAFPELKAEILFSELAYKAVTMDLREAEVMNSLFYRLMVSYNKEDRCKYYWSVYGKSGLLLPLCMALNVESPCHRLELIKKAVRSCEERYRINPEFEQMAVLLRKFLAEEKQKAH